MRYLIALPLKESESDEFIKLRDKYKDYAPRWKITLGPHITLFRPSEFKMPIDDAIKEFKKAPVYKDFSVNFKNFEAFMNHSNNAVYSEPVRHDDFEKIKELYEPQAGKILQEIADVWPYHPHLTLVNRLDTENAEKLIDELKGADFDKKYSFDRICLYKKDHEDKNWVEIASNKLEK
jgi:2'-5' RNA ligase